MPVTVVESHSLSLDGPIPSEIVVALGCALLGLFLWSLRRERAAIGDGNLLLFGVLRIAALVVALVMLLAPMHVHSREATTQRAVAVVVDVSGSMQTVDPPEGVDFVRWAAAASDGPQFSLVQAADRAVTSLQMAGQRLSAALSALRDHESEEKVLERVVAGCAALQRARESIGSIVEGLEQRDATEPVQKAAVLEDARQLVQLLEGADVRRLESLATDLREGGRIEVADWRERLSDLHDRMAGICRRSLRLAEAVGSAARAESAASGVPRIQRVARFVEGLGESILGPLEDAVDVRRAAFDESFTLLGDDGTAAALMSRVSAGRAASSHDPRGAVAGSEVADPPGTDLAAALEGLRATDREVPLAAVFLLTDAGHNRTESGDPRKAAAGLGGTPVYVVPIGSTRHVRDVELQAVSAPGVVMKDDDVVIEAAVQAYECAGEVCRVELLKNAEVVEHRDVTFDTASSLQRVRFHAQMRDVGVQHFQIRVAPLPGELSEENNFEPCQITVTRNQIDVLLADELPRWEYRYLTQLFRRDPKVNCDELLFRPRVIATGRRSETEAFPTSVDEWDAYDVVILGDVSSERLSVNSQRGLGEFLRKRGGTLVVIAGDGAMPHAFVNQPLEEWLPVTRGETVPSLESLDGYAYHVTEEGWRHDALMITDTESSSRIAWDFINRNAPLYAVSAYRHAKPAARTLIAAFPRAGLEIEPDPAKNVFLCWQPVGRGRVVYLAGPETYRLRYLRGDRLHYRFWGQMLRWAIADDLAAGSELARIRSDRATYRNGDRVDVKVEFAERVQTAVAEGDVRAVAVSAGGSRVAIGLRADASIPGAYHGSFERLPAGIYQLEVESPALDEALQSTVGSEAGSGVLPAGFTVHTARNRELLDTRSDRALAQQIAEASGGLVVPPTAVGEVLALTDLEPIVTQTTEARPLWVRWELLWIVFGCLFAEWVVRKRLGLS